MNKLALDIASLHNFCGNYIFGDRPIKGRMDHIRYVHRLRKLGVVARDAERFVANSQSVTYPWINDLIQKNNDLLREIEASPQTNAAAGIAK